MNSEYQEKLNKAKGQRKQIKKYLNKLAKNPPKDLDTQFHKEHDKAFEKIDCLQCANCCKTTGPLFTRTDRDRIAKYLGLKTIEFEEQYLRFDEDGDWVLKQTPCTFLDENNYCTIYDIRPKACAGFPHTDHIGMKNIMGITEKNTRVCPAVSDVVFALMDKK